MKKYRVIDWIDAEDHWEIVHEVDMEVNPAPGEMVVIVSSVEGLARGDIIDGQGNLFKKAEPPAPPYGNAIQILEQEKQNLQNTINLIVENELPDLNMHIDSCNTAIQELITISNTTGWKDGKGKPQGDPDLADANSPEERIQVYRNKANVWIELLNTKQTEISNMQTQISNIETKIAEWQAIKEAWDAEHLN